MTYQEYSTLEPVHPGHEPLRNGGSLAAEKQVVANEAGKEIVTDKNGKEAIPPNEQYITAIGGYNEPQNFDTQVTQQPKRKRIWWWIGGVILLLVILGAILGGVLGTRKSKSSSLTNSTNSTMPNTTAEVPAYKIAAVSFKSGSVDNSRIYYQDNAGILVEAAKTPANKTWSFTKIASLEKNNSALAAAVSRPGFPLEISVFYTDNNDYIHDIIYNSTSQEWNEGKLSRKTYTAYPNATMSAMYNQCRLCANTTLMSYQDRNGIVQIAKFEDGGWTLSGLDIDPIRGTGLALQPSYKANQADKIMLFHQKSNLNISLAIWDPVSRMTVGSEIYSEAPFGTPIAGASSYSNVTGGYETWRQLLRLSDSGVKVSTWSGSKNDWIRYDFPYTAFANETVTNVQLYGSVAVTAIGNAYAIVEKPPGNFSIQSYQMTDGLLGWSNTGNVTAWG